MADYLRPYQRRELIKAYRSWKAGCTRQLWCLPTGAGKTLCAAIIPQWKILGEKGQLWFLVHLDELVGQAERTFKRINPTLRVGIEKAEQYASPDLDIVIASIPSVERNDCERIRRFDRRRIRAVVCDEAHHLVSNQHRAVVTALGVMKGDPDADPSRLFAGITATPLRSSGEGLEAFFDEITISVGMRELMTTGPEINGSIYPWLADAVAYQINTDIDLDQVKIRAGDFMPKDLGRLINTPERNALVVRKYQEFGLGLPGLAFTCSIEHSHDLASAFNTEGLPAVAVSGNTSRRERDSIIARYNTGEIKVLTSCSVFVEGFDLPRATVNVLAKPTRSNLLYCLDGETEILSSEGWKTIGNIIPGDIVCAVEPEDLRAQWVPADSVIERIVCPEEKMASLVSARMNFRVSDKHRMLCFDRHGNHPDFVLAEQLAVCSHSYKLPVAAISSFPDAPLTDDELRLIGWFLTDGCHNRKNNAINICQSITHPEYITEIRSILDSCRIRYGEAKRTGSNFGSKYADRIVFYFSKGDPRKISERNKRGWSYLSAYLDKSFTDSLMAVSDRQLGVMLEAMNKGNGSKCQKITWTRRSYDICFGNKRLAERIQIACITHGFACNLSIIPASEKRKSEFYMLHIKKRAFSIVGGTTLSHDRPTLALADPKPSERVWCVSNRIGTIVTRRKGKVCIVGNCQMLGRTFRPYPAPEDYLRMVAAGQRPDYIKPHAIILDFADNCGRHAGALMQLPTLYGLRPDFNMRGKSVTEVVEEIEQLLEVQPAIDLQHCRSIEDVRSQVDSVDLFAVPVIPEKIRKLAKFHWFQLWSDSYQLRTLVGTVEIRQNLLGAYEIYVSRNGQRVLRNSLSDLREAVQFGESLVPPEERTLHRKSAKWLSKEPTFAQCDLLRNKDNRFRARFESSKELFRHVMCEFRNGNKSYSRGGISRAIDRMRLSGLK